MDKDNVKNIDAENIFSNGVLVSLKTRLWGATGKLESDQFEIIDETMDKKYIKTSMTLLKDTNLIDAMKQTRSAAQRFIKAHSIYFPEKSFSFIPKNLIEYVDENLSKYKFEFLEYGKNLVSKLKELELEFSEKHPKLYDPSKYPSVEKLESMIAFEYNFRIFSTPDKKLGIISPEIYKKEMDKFKNDIDQMKKQTINIVCKEIKERIDTLQAQCENAKVNNATLKTIENLLDKFDKIWNGFVDEEEIRKMIKDIKLYVKDTDADMYNWDSDFRQMVANKAIKISKTLENKDFKRSIEF